MSTIDDAVADAPVIDDPAAQGWKLDGQGRWSVPARGKRGNVYRRGNETPDEAHARAELEASKDRPPKGKRDKVPTGAKPPAPTQVSLKDLEFVLAEGLKSPAMLCAMVGDEWPAEHFTRHGPVLARNLVKASETNPWLREKLEAATRGEDWLFKFMGAAGVAGALMLYAAPPAIYYLNPKFIPREADQMLGIPQRKGEPDPNRRHADPAAPPSGTPDQNPVGASV